MCSLNLSQKVSFNVFFEVDIHWIQNLNESLDFPLNFFPVSVNNFASSLWTLNVFFLDFFSTKNAVLRILHQIHYKRELKFKLILCIKIFNQSAAL